MSEDGRNLKCSGASLLWTHWAKENVSSLEVSFISEVDLYTKVYYWDLRNCPD